MRSLIAPNFFIAGMPKCGTTALAAYLQKHPDVMISEPKEPHYFSAYYDELDYEDYIRSCYKRYKGEKIVGEATPLYLRFPWALERMAAHCPDAKFIALFRNPVDRAYSQWWMFYSRAMEPLSFADAINACFLQDPKSEENQTLWQQYVRHIKAGKTIPVRPYLSNGYYAKYLREFLKFFRRDQILIIQTEEFHKNIRKTMDDVYHFLNISAYHDESIRRRNEAYGTAARKVFAILKRTGITRFSQSVPEASRDRIKRVLAKAGSRQPLMDSAMRLRLSKYYEPCNLDLENLLGRSFRWT